MPLLENLCLSCYKLIKVKMLHSNSERGFFQSHKDWNFIYKVFSDFLQIGKILSKRIDLFKTTTIVIHDFHEKLTKSNNQHKLHTFVVSRQLFGVVGPTYKLVAFSFFLFFTSNHEADSRTSPTSPPTRRQQVTT